MFQIKIINITMMRRVCCDGHPVLEDNISCYAGHPRGVSFECQEPDCIYVTKPTTMSGETLAKNDFHNHMVATHGAKADVSEEEKGKPRHTVNLLICDKETTRPMQSEDKNIQSELENRTCQFCYKMFSSKYNVKRHIRYEHMRSGSFLCDKCGKSFASQASYHYHVKSHSEDSKFDCEKCSETFSDFNNYARHRNAHRSPHFQLEHKCEECGIIICGKGKLSRHQQEVHDIETRFNINKTSVSVYPHKCFQCSARYKRKHDLDRHIEAKHSQHEGYSCGKCTKTFKYSSSHKRHIKTCTAAIHGHDNHLKSVEEQPTCQEPLDTENWVSVSSSIGRERTLSPPGTTYGLAHVKKGQLGPVMQLANAQLGQGLHDGCCKDAPDQTRRLR